MNDGVKISMADLGRVFAYFHSTLGEKFMICIRNSPLAGANI